MNEFLAQYWHVLLFYAGVGVLLYIFRKRFEFHGIVALLKTKLGLKFMTETGSRWPRFWHGVGLAAIIIGFLGMAFITGYILWGLYALFFVPAAPPALSPIIPGARIPGVPFHFPLGYTLIALFFAVVVHEAAHGIFSAAYKIKIKSSGFAFFGPLPGAFVEPDEKQMKKRPTRQQLAIFAAGPFANVLLAILAFTLTIGVGLLAASLVTEQGVTFTSFQEDGAIAAAGLTEPTTITAIGGTPIRNIAGLTETLAPYSPGEVVNIATTSGSYEVTLAANPNDADRPYLGILGVQTATQMKNPDMEWLFDGLMVVAMALIWIYIISLGLGVANLLPLGPIDGGRMFLLALSSFIGEKRAMPIFTRASIAMLLLVLVLVFVPIIRAVF
jgi:membrane-associated protease RseP (regulator of RpoE activity)